MPEGGLMQDGPSPIIPIVMLSIVGVMLSLSSIFEVESGYMQATYDYLQSHFYFGAFLIPVCIFLVVQAVGMPGDHSSGPGNPVVESFMQDPTTSILLFVVIVCLLFAIPFHNYLHAPWQPPPYYERP